MTGSLNDGLYYNILLGLMSIGKMVYWYGKLKKRSVMVLADKYFMGELLQCV